MDRGQGSQCCSSSNAVAAQQNQQADNGCNGGVLCRLKSEEGVYLAEYHEFNDLPSVIDQSETPTVIAAQELQFVDLRI